MRISDWSSDVCSSDLVRLAKPGAAELDRRGQLFDRLILTEDDALEVRVQRLEHLLVVGGDGFRRDARNGRDDCLHLAGGDRLLALGRRHQHLRRAHLVDHVDRLRSEEHPSELQSLMRISYAVFCLKKKKQNKQKQINHITY